MRDCPVCCRMFHTVPRLYLCDASSTFPALNSVTITNLKMSHHRAHGALLASWPIASTVRWRRGPEVSFLPGKMEASFLCPVRMWLVPAHSSEMSSVTLSSKSWLKEAALVQRTESNTSVSFLSDHLSPHDIKGNNYEWFYFLFCIHSCNLNFLYFL